MPRVERRCPVCGEGLVASTAGAACGTCGRLYADSTSGIADLRLAFPDPELSRDDDARLGAALDELSAERDLAALIDEHWRLVGKRPELAARFTAQEVSARSRSEPIVDAIAAARGAAIGPDDTALEVGCGTAALASAIARRGASVVATDLSLRWLVLARTRLAEESAHRVELVACAAEALPFPDESFSVVAASDVVEHVEDPDRFVAECSRVLRPGGLLFLATPNRFSLGLEPHVRLWGVGFLPRRAAEAYVRTCRHTSYAHVRLLSARSLARLLSDHGFESEIVTPAVAESSVPMYSGMEQTLVRAYNHVRTRSAARPVLRAVGPFFHVFGRKADRR
jgi:ubiquinone/menaquinone biosynthesis C-methylase UbiE